MYTFCTRRKFWFWWTLLQLEPSAFEVCFNIIETPVEGRCLFWWYPSGNKLSESNDNWKYLARKKNFRMQKVLCSDELWQQISYHWVTPDFTIHSSQSWHWISATLTFCVFKNRMNEHFLHAANISILMNVTTTWTTNICTMFEHHYHTRWRTMPLLKLLLSSTWVITDCLTVPSIWNLCLGKKTFRWKRFLSFISRLDCHQKWRGCCQLRSSLIRLPHSSINFDT